jgi:hypothetical protein
MEILSLKLHIEEHPRNKIIYFLKTHIGLHTFFPHRFDFALTEQLE